MWSFTGSADSTLNYKVDVKKNPFAIVVTRASNGRVLEVMLVFFLNNTDVLGFLWKPMLACKQCMFKMPHVRCPLAHAVYVFSSFFWWVFCKDSCEAFGNKFCDMQSSVWKVLGLALCSLPPSAREIFTATLVHQFEESLLPEGLLANASNCMGNTPHCIFYLIYRNHAEALTHQNRVALETHDTQE